MSGLAEKKISDSQSRMGRPPLGVVATVVRLSPDLLARIDALAGPGKRADFIRKAVEAELARREREG
ncbi:hypothetical protein [Novosphingobium aromaticivorans]|uniref:hypothetical protein n=1 Tax=Novosphingobium aromaticivorans TaxID=48935 RepID=UPI00115FE11E|nr:hypothetical protein [Novosphingobium aromaticivorans]